MTNTMDFPAIEGRPVTQGHADICASRGHAKWTVDGTDTSTCPRCGEVVGSAAFASYVESQIISDMISTEDYDTLSYADLRKVQAQLQERIANAAVPTGCSYNSNVRRLRKVAAALVENFGADA